jgi:PAS domain S-box-containing protein/putative nucleotidyltransferase with HDIG domain
MIGKKGLHLKKLIQKQDQPRKELEIFRKSKQFNQLMLDNVHDLVAIHKLEDLSYKYVNPVTLRVLGYSQEEIFAKNMLELIHPDDMVKMLSNLKELLPIKEGQNEFRYLKKNGSYVWLEVTGTIVPHEIDEDSLIMISRDITARKQAETALQKANDELEMKVQEKTLQLNEFNAQLQTKIIEQQQSEAEVKSSEERFRTLFEKAPVGITINRNGRTLFANQTYASMFGYKSGLKLIGTPIINQIAPGERHAVGNIIKKRAKGETASGFYETTGLRKDGSIFPLFVQVNNVLLPDGPANVAFLSDITTRKQAETSLLRKMTSQALRLEIANNFIDIAIDDIDDMIETTLRMIGEYDHDDRSYIGVFFNDQYVLSDAHEWCAEGIAATLDNLQELSVSAFPWLTHNLRSFEYTYIPRVEDLPPEAQAEKEMLQAQSIQSLIYVPMSLEDKITGFLGLDSVRREKTWSEDSISMFEAVAQIISKALLRKKSARELQVSENYYRTIFENAGAASMILDEDMTVTMVNDEGVRLLGYAREDLIGKKWTDFISLDRIETMQEYHRLRRINPAAAPLKYQTRMINRQGKHRDGLLAVDMIPGTTNSVANFIDFTEFNRLDRALKAISAANIAMIQAENEEALLQNVCRKIAEVGGYSLVWVAYLQTDPQQTVKPVAYAGKDRDYLDKVNITLQDAKRGRGPTGIAIRTRQPIVFEDLKIEVTFKPWLKDALRLGFQSIMAIPLLDENMAFGALSIYSSEIDQFDSDEKKLLIEMANNLAFTIMSIRTRNQQKLTALELEKSLEQRQRILMQAVASLGTALDIRDPYTAGHQRKAARLATAIAAEMGFSKDQLEGMWVAGVLHDIGKISVPSEILSKPGKLSELEYAIIKNHPQAGYEIVKDIEFPWPVAEVLLQHHERMNGSGYPQGLAGGDILVEARIMEVADVVEAMASHRPYRPALGIDAALEELVQNRGILYDPGVVDACLTLFREKGFKLE